MSSWGSRRRQFFNLSDELRSFLAAVSLCLDDKIDETEDEKEKETLKKEKEGIRKTIKESLEIMKKYPDPLSKYDKPSIDLNE